MFIWKRNNTLNSKWWIFFLNDGRFGGQCAFMSISWNLYTCSSGVWQLFLRLSWGHDRTLHSVYFTAEGMKTCTRFLLEFNSQKITILFVEFTYAKIAHFEAALAKILCLLNPCLHTRRWVRTLGRKKYHIERLNYVKTV